MKLNPYLNALAAVAYIGGVAQFLRFMESMHHDTPDTLLGSMGFLSLLVLSASVMAFLFFYQPLSLLLENKRAEAVAYFLKTLITFGIATLALLAFVSVA